MCRYLFSIIKLAYACSNIVLYREGADISILYQISLYRISLKEWAAVGVLNNSNSKFLGSVGANFFNKREMLIKKHRRSTVPSFSVISSPSSALFISMRYWASSIQELSLLRC